MEAAPNPDGAPAQSPAKAELPAVESPPLSPGTDVTAASEPVAEPAAQSAAEPAIGIAVEPAPEPAVEPAQIIRPRFVVKARHKRHALLAASVAIAASVGAVLGVAASGGLSSPPPVNVAAAEENKAMQQSLTRLAKEVTTLKANLEAANKTAHSQIAKINERFEQQAADVTGSISPPQTTAPVPAAVAAPLPMPRPAIAAAAAPARPQVVQGWTIRDTRSGYVYVQNNGAIYQVVPGAPLPGLGPVESIRRQDGRWIVMTPRGMIVSMRDRRYFDPY